MPLHILVMWHTVVMVRVAILQSGVCPLSASAVFHSVASRIFEIVWRRSNHQMNRTIGYLFHYINGTATDDFIQKVFWKFCFHIISKVGLLKYPTLRQF